MLQGSPGEINTPVLRREPSQEWFGQQWCSRDFFFFSPFITPFFLPSHHFSVGFLVMADTTIAWASIKPPENADFNARWENTGGFTAGSKVC